MMRAAFRGGSVLVTYEAPAFSRWYFIKTSSRKGYEASFKIAQVLGFMHVQSRMGARRLLLRQRKIYTRHLRVIRVSFYIRVQLQSRYRVERQAIAISTQIVQSILAVSRVSRASATFYHRLKKMFLSYRKTKRV